MKAEAIQTIKSTMEEAIWAIKNMNSVETFFGNLKDERSKEIVKKSKEIAAQKIAEVGLTLEGLHEKLETAFSN